jgi:hypothetical protein
MSTAVRDRGARKWRKVERIRILPYTCSVDLNSGVLTCSRKCSKNERL